MVLLLMPLLYAQTMAPPRFEVAAIKPSNPDLWNGESGGRSGGGRYMIHNRTLRDYIWRAYHVQSDRVLGGPVWLDTDRYDIDAKAEQPIGDDAIMEMLQTLMAERFHLKLHRETRTAEALVLGVAKGGPKLPAGGTESPSYSSLHDHYDATNLPMDRFAESLSRDLKIPVVDRTGLAGGFTFTLRWNPDPPGLADPADAVAYLRAEISRALARQLGLMLESRRVPVEVIVIDRAEKPTAN